MNYNRKDYGMSILEEITKMSEEWSSSSKDEQDKLLIDSFHGMIDHMMDDLFLSRKIHLLWNVESEEATDAYIVESAKQAKARYENLTQEEADLKMQSRVLKKIVSTMGEGE